MSATLAFVFLASLGASSFAMKRLYHELDHATASIVRVVDHEVGHRHADQTRQDDSEHELLHALAQIQPAPLPAFDWPATKPSGLVRGAFIALAVSHATRDAPFRPPRARSSFA